MPKCKQYGKKKAKPAKSGKAKKKALTAKRAKAREVNGEKNGTRKGAKGGKPRNPEDFNRPRSRGQRRVHTRGLSQRNRTRRAS